MGVKFIKVRFNTDNPADKAAYDILKKADRQNAFIKDAILLYEENRKNEQLIEKIIAAVKTALSDVQFVQSNTAPAKETADNSRFSDSADIADAFLDSL